MWKQFAVAILMAIRICPLTADGTPLYDIRAEAPSGSIPVYGYDLINTFPHDSGAFTQGLVYHNGFLYEGTGLYGASSLRKVVLETGEVLKRYNLASAYFGEGVTVYNDTIFQLTWRNHVAFAYIELEDFELINTFTYPYPGWGLTHDDTSLIASDGTDKIYNLDPSTLEEVGRVYVTADGSPVDSLNELEYVRGRIYANILNSDSIAIIEPQTGNVVAWIDLTGILPPARLAQSPGPLNGIAFDPASVRLFVTGKKWPSLFEIYTDPLDYPPEIVEASPPSPVWIHLDTPVILTVSVEDRDPADSLEYTWRIDGVVDPAARDSCYEYSSSNPTVDTLVVEVSDGVFSDSTSWIVYVEIAGIEDDHVSANSGQVSVRLSQNRPNPFRNLTTIDFTLPGSSCLNRRVCLAVHDIRGRKVRTLVDSDLRPGDHSIVWDGADHQGNRVPPGIFFCVLSSGKSKISNKMVVLE